MKKRYIPIIMAFCLLLSLALPAGAADISAKMIADKYRTVLNNTTYHRYYSDAVAFYDLNGDVIPEMFVATAGSQGNEGSLINLEIWTWKNSAPTKVGAVVCGIASSDFALFVNKNGKLLRYGITSTDHGSVSSYDLITFDSSWEMTITTATKASDKSPDKVLLGSNYINGQQYTSAAKTKSQAITYLNGITGQFFDVPSGAYYSLAVDWAVKQGITTGTGVAAFSPNQTCTRAQAVTFLWRAAGQPKVSGSTGFSDVSSKAYYAEAVKWAAKNNVTTGTGNGKFSPDTDCTRAQIVTFLWRAAGSPKVSGSTGFSDVPSNAYYANAVKWAVKNNITTGTGNGKFSPDSECTRAQIVTFLYRAKDINIEPLTEKSWSEAYEEFVLDYEFLNAGQAYTFGENSSFSGFPVYLYDIDRDGTPELIINNGETGRATRYSYIYTYVNGEIVYLDIGPTDGAYDPNDRNGLIGTFQDSGYMSVTSYKKSGIVISRERIAEYDNFEWIDSSYVNALIYISSFSIDSISGSGWNSFLATQPI